MTGGRNVSLEEALESQASWRTPGVAATPPWPPLVSPGSSQMYGLGGSSPGVQQTSTCSPSPEQLQQLHIQQMQMQQLQMQQLQQLHQLQLEQQLQLQQLQMQHQDHLDISETGGQSGQSLGTGPGFGLCLESQTPLEAFLSATSPFGLQVFDEAHLETSPWNCGDFEGGSGCGWVNEQGAGESPYIHLEEQVHATPRQEALPLPESNSNSELFESGAVGAVPHVSASSEPLTGTGSVLTRNDKDAATEGTATAEDIAAAVADFLSGKFEEDSEASSVSMSEGRAAGDRCGARDTPPALAPGHAPSSDSARCLQRGRELSQSLSKMRLSLDMPEEAAWRLCQMVCRCISELQQRGIKPTVLAIQERLREWAVQELEVQMVLSVCVRHPEVFTFWVTSDGQLCVLMATEQIQPSLLAESFDGPYTIEFLEVLAERVSKLRTGLGSTTQGAPAPLCIAAQANTSKEKQTLPETPGAIPAVAPVPVSLTPVSAQRPSALALTPASVSQGKQRGVPPDAEAKPGSWPGQREPRRRETPQGAGVGAGTSSSALAANLARDKVTTLMIRNLPSSVTQKRLVEELMHSGFSEAEDYDFCYMPSTFGTGITKGYAFINLKTPTAMLDFVKTWHGSRRFGISPLEAALNVSAAIMQGLEENVKKWHAPRMRRVRNPALRPLLMASPQDDATLGAGQEGVPGFANAAPSIGLPPGLQLET